MWFTWSGLWGERPRGWGHREEETPAAKKVKSFSPSPIHPLRYSFITLVQPGRGEGRASEKQNTASWFPAKAKLNKIRHYLTKMHWNMRTSEDMYNAQPANLFIENISWHLVHLSQPGGSIYEAQIFHTVQQISVLYDNDPPVCKSGHYGLNPAGRIVQGLDKEVP